MNMNNALNIPIPENAGPMCREWYRKRMTHGVGKVTSMSVQIQTPNV